MLFRRDSVFKWLKIPYMGGPRTVSKGDETVCKFACKIMFKPFKNTLLIKLDSQGVEYAD
jgi:hypothetical protein